MHLLIGETVMKEEDFMKIKDKLLLDAEGLKKHGAITIVAFGDSVTHGFLAKGEINYETVYWERLRQKILKVKNYVPVNVIDSGIGGDNTPGGLKRIDEQVIAHNPDLVIVCFGLNDIVGELETYISSLRSIFEKLQNCGTDIIFMTPNMLNQYFAEDTAYDREYAHRTAEYQSSGRMDLFINSAIALANEMGVTVCDCYSKWKELSKEQDTTLLLANRINHPKAEMHKLFADELFKIISADFPKELMQPLNEN